MESFNSAHLFWILIVCLIICTSFWFWQFFSPYIVPKSVSTVILVFVLITNFGCSCEKDAHYSTAWPCTLSFALFLLILNLIKHSNQSLGAVSAKTMRRVTAYYCHLWVLQVVFVRAQVLAKYHAFTRVLCKTVRSLILHGPRHYVGVSTVSKTSSQTLHKYLNAMQTTTFSYFG